MYVTRGGIFVGERYARLHTEFGNLNKGAILHIRAVGDGFFVAEAYGMPGIHNIPKSVATPFTGVFEWRSNDSGVPYGTVLLSFSEDYFNQIQTVYSLDGTEFNLPAQPLYFLYG